MIDPGLIVITVVASVALVSVARILSRSAHIKAYKDAAKVKDDMIDDLRFRVRSLKGRISHFDSPPSDIDGIEDIGNIVRHLPKPLRPFAKPIIAWAETAEGKLQIGKLIAKWSKDSKKEPGAGAPGEESL